MVTYLTQLIAILDDRCYTSVIERNGGKTMGDEYRWNGKDDGNQNVTNQGQNIDNTKDNAGEDRENYGYYQINQTSDPDVTQQNSNQQETIAQGV